VTVVALQESTGQQAWQYVPEVTLYTASLAAVSNGTLDVVLSDARLIGISTATGAKQWEVALTQPSFPFSAPAVDDGAVYVADHQGDLQSVHPATGDTDWLFAFNERVVRSSPVIVGNRVLLGLADGSLGVVDRSTGHLVWRSRATSGQIGGIAVAPSAIVAEKGGQNGGLVAFRTDPSGTLLDVESPTVPHYGSIAARFAIAFAVVGALALGIFTPLSRRLGPADFSIEDERLAEDGVADDDEGGP
jgi:outer membrane protein assembly factor BamB